MSVVIYREGQEPLTCIDEDAIKIIEVLMSASETL
jgi:hypothetical protein